MESSHIWAGSILQQQTKPTQILLIALFVFSINRIRQNASRTVIAVYFNPIFETQWDLMGFNSNTWLVKMAGAYSKPFNISLFWYYIKQIMNVFIRAMVRIFSFGKRWNVPFNSAYLYNSALRFIIAWHDDIESIKKPKYHMYIK
jgi:hypothetical protein